MDHLDALEAQSIYILREAYKKLGKLGMLWSIGKDSTVLLWLAKKAFFGHCPFPFIHVDTTYKIPEMIAFRDKVARELDLDLIVHTNTAAIEAGMNPRDYPKLVCCKALKMCIRDRTWVMPSGSPQTSTGLSGICTSMSS